MNIKNFFEKIKKFYHQKILKRKYYRIGKCVMCGACCENIYVRHAGKIIKNEQEFKKILEEDGYAFYKHIRIIGCDDFGLLFACNKFDKEKRLCSDHKHRPLICRKYPHEVIFSFGASLKETCGYSFVPIESFSEVFSKIKKKPVKEFEACKD